MNPSGSGGSYKLKSVNEIPQKYRCIFQEYNSFNAVQSRCFDDVFHSDKHIVVGAPTSSGKTVIFELAIIRLLEEAEKKKVYIHQCKIVYVAPIKALCKERLLDWEQKFNPIGIKCKEVTGDHEITDFQDLEDVQLILTTPEKWDSLTRKWRENRRFVDCINLFMIDEIHLLNDPKRGPCLEAVISRMKTIFDVGRIFKGEDISVKGDTNQLRFVAVSATIPNIEDLAMWLGHGYADSIKYFAIPDEMRPVKLKKIVLGYEWTHNSTYFRFDMTLNYQLVDVINRYSSGKPTMIFCSTRRAVEMAANVLVTDLRINFRVQQQQALMQISNQITDTKLRGSIAKGIAYHHAGLALNDRTLVENGFRQGNIPVLLCTSTLAMGINLPAHLVIIKSTQSYQQGSVDELSENTIWQMIGRAGRPQFDASGVAVIMTQQQKKLDYEHLVHMTKPIESHLHKCLAEHLNSEIVLQTITDLSIAVQWMKSTFFYVRASRDPTRYGITDKFDKDRLLKKLEEMCLVAINALERHGLITKNSECVIRSTPYGRLMARYYVNFETMKLFGQIIGNENLSGILSFITQSAEFSDFKLRRSDKRTLNELNRSKIRETIRFQMKGKVMTVPAKISCLMQAVMGNLPVDDISLNQEAFKIMQHGERLSNCLYDYLVLKEKQEISGYFLALLNTAIIRKCFYVKLWENSVYLTKQFRRIGPQLANTLSKSGLTTIDSIINTDPRQIEMLVKKAPPFGNDVRSEALRYPSYEIQMILQGKSTVDVKVFQNNGSCDHNLKSKAFLFIGDNQNNLLFYRDELKFHFVSTANEKFQGTFNIDPNSKYIICELVHKSLVGVDKSITLNFKSVNSQPKQKTTKTTSKPIKQVTSRKLTEYFKEKRQDLNNKIESPESLQNDMNDEDDIVFMEDSTSESYSNLFRGTALANMTSHRSTPVIDETSNDSTAFQVIVPIENEEPQFESRYRIMEIRQPTPFEKRSCQEQELSEISCLTLSDDENLTVDEGELVLDCESTQQTEENVTKKSMTDDKLKTPDLKRRSTVVDQSEPIIKKFAPMLQTHHDVNASNSITKWAFTTPLADYLPQCSPAPTVWTEEEEERLNYVFYGENINKDAIGSLTTPSVIQSSDGSKNNHVSYSRDSNHDSDLEIVSCVEEIERSLLHENSVLGTEIGKRPNDNITSDKVAFISAKTALVQDMKRLGNDPGTCILDNNCNENVPDKVCNTDAKEKTGEKISYLNSFLLGEYKTPIVMEQECDLSMQHICQVNNIGEYRKAIKKHFPNVPLAINYLTYKDPTKTKLDVVDFDEFMSASDDTSDNFITPRRNEDFHVMSAKIKRAHTRPTSDQNYFCEVLSQMCDQPEKAQIEFDFNETWKSIVKNLESETEQNDRNEENLNEEQLKERMKDIEASYFESLQVQQDYIEKGAHKENPDDENKDSNMEINHPSHILATDICDTTKEEPSLDLPNLDNFTQYIRGEKTIQHDPPDDFEEEYADIIQDIYAAFPDSSQKDQTHSVDNLMLNDSQQFEPKLSESFKEEYSDILQEIDAVFPASAQQEILSSNLIRQSSTRCSKTLGIKRSVIQPSIQRQEPMLANPGHTLPSVNFSPVHLPAQPRFRELFYVPSTRYIPSFNVSRVNPFKLRQPSAFARKPLRMRHMERMIETFRNERQVIGGTAAISANTKSTIHQNEDQGTIRRPISPKDNHFRNVIFGNRKLDPSNSNISNESYQSVPKSSIKFRPEYDPMSLYRTRTGISNPSNLGLNANILGHNTQNRKTTFEQPPHPVFAKGAIPQDPLFWLNEPPPKLAKDDGFKLLRDKLLSNASSTLGSNKAFVVSKRTTDTLMFPGEDPGTFVNHPSHFDPSNFFNADSGFPF